MPCSMMSPNTFGPSAGTWQPWRGSAFPSSPSGWTAKPAGDLSRASAALYRLEQGNISNVRRLGKGISEYKIAFGPGYRIYFGLEGDDRVVLLGGGTKKKQSVDIQRSRERWRSYQSRKN